VKFVLVSGAVKAYNKIIGKNVNQNI